MAQSSVASRQLTWLITGCSSGFGLSLVRQVQSQGHRVIATSRTPSKTPELVAEVEEKGGKWLKLDVTDPNSAEFIKQLETSGTDVDVLVNNAGFCTFSPIETSSDQDIKDQMEAMYFGPLRLIKAVIPFMRERKFGVIANFSSGAALDGNPTMGPYAGAKAALDATTRVLAKEVAAFNIRAWTVILGTSNTNFGTGEPFGTQPIPDAYSGSMVEKMISYVKTGNVPINGDKDKAMKAVFDVIAGGGHAGQGMLPLGPDMVDRVKGVRDSLDKTLHTFGDLAQSIKYKS